MAYRAIHTKIWRDPWFIDLEPDGKLLWLWLCTNEATNIAGVYEVSERIAAFETGLERRTVSELMEQFCAAGKLEREGAWVWVVKLMYYNASNLSSRDVMANVEKTLSTVPDGRLKTLFRQRYTPSLQGVDTLPTPSLHPVMTVLPAAAEQSRAESEAEQHQDSSSTEQEPGAPDVRAALLPAANIAALAAACIGEPERSELAALPFMEPAYVEAWRVDVGRREDAKNPTGLLIHCLRSGQWPDPPKRARHRRNGDPPSGADYAASLARYGMAPNGEPLEVRA